MSGICISILNKSMILLCAVHASILLFFFLSCPCENILTVGRGGLCSPKLYAKKSTVTSKFYIDLKTKCTTDVVLSNQMNKNIMQNLFLYFQTEQY